MFPNSCFLVSVLSVPRIYILQEELRPFFSLPKVMDGLFNLAKRLFGIIIEPADGLAPVVYFSSFIFTPRTQEIERAPSCCALLTFYLPNNILLSFIGLES